MEGLFHSSDTRIPEILDSTKAWTGSTTFHLPSHKYMQKLHRHFQVERDRQMKEVRGNYIREIADLEVILQNQVPLPHQKLFEVQTRNLKDFWTFYDSSGFFVYDEVEPLIIRESHLGIRKQVIQSYVWKIAHQYGYTLSKPDIWSNIIHGYHMYNPLKGVALVLNLKVHKKKKQLIRQFSVRREFSNLYCMEDPPDAITRNESIRVNFVVPVGGRQDTVVQFMNRWEEEFLKTGEKVSLTLVVADDKKRRTI